MSCKRNEVVPSSSFFPELLTASIAASKTLVPETKVLRKASSSALTVASILAYCSSRSGYASTIASLEVRKSWANTGSLTPSSLIARTVLRSSLLST